MKNNNSQIDSIKNQLDMQNKYLTADNYLFDITTKIKREASIEEIQLYDAIELIEQKLKEIKCKQNFTK